MNKLMILILSLVILGCTNMPKTTQEIIGWREWVSLDDYAVSKIKAKVDTGARTSSLHAFDMKFSKKGAYEYVSFSIHPAQDSAKGAVRVKARVIEYRKVKSSNGKSELRPVIKTNISLKDQTWETEITLTNRDEMGFRMLLGRQSIRKKFLVDAGRSFLGDKKRKKK